MSGNNETVEIGSDGLASATLGPGEYELLVSSAGYQDGSATVTLDSDQTVTVALDAIPTYTVTLVVEDTAGTPIEGASVSGDFAGETDATGEFTADVIDGEYTVEVTADGFSTQTTTVTVSGGPASQTVTLSEGSYSVYITVADSDGNALADATVTLDGETQTTDGAGEVLFDRPNGSYDVSISAEGYSDRSATITVDGGSIGRAYALLPEYDVPTEYDYQQETDADGRTTFGGIPTQDYDVEVGKDHYETYTDRISHLGDRTRSAGLARSQAPPVEDPDAPDEPDEPDEPDDPDVDPGPEEPGEPINPLPSIALPDIAAYFEATALSTTADEDFRVPVLVSNVAGNQGSTAIRLEREDGTLVDRNVVSLAPGGYQILWFSVRPLYEEGVSIPVRVRTNNTTDWFEVSFASDPDTIEGTGRPYTLGGRRPATLGGRLPGTLGQWREYGSPSEPDLATRENGWALTLENPAGQRKFIDVVSEPDPQRVHTQLSDWTADVPTDPDLHEWTFDVRMWLTYDERLTFTGWCRSAESTPQTTTLSGTGPAGELNEGSYEFELTGLAEWRAIEKVIDEVAPEWDWHVVRPDEPTIIHDETVSGTPLECITQLHEDYGMRYLIDHRQFRRAISFAPGGVVADVEFPVISSESRERSMEGYANRADVKGARREETDEKYQATWSDEDEIERLAGELGILESEATKTYPVREADITSDRQALARAKGVVRERSENLELAGSFDVPAQLVEPGLQYSMPWDEDVATGAHALFFGGTGYVSIDTPRRRSFEESGAITMRVRATWSDLEDREARLIGTRSTDDPGIRTEGADSLSFFAEGETDGGDRDAGWGRVDTYPGELTPPDDEWITVGFDWSISDGETTIRTFGPDGVVSVAFGDEVSIPSTLYLGRHRNDYFVGSMEDVRMGHGPLTADADGTPSIPGERLIAHYPMDESGSGTDGRVHDVLGGHHGWRYNTTVIGTPQTLHEVSFDRGAASLQFTRNTTRQGQIERLMSEVNRLQR